MASALGVIIQNIIEALLGKSIESAGSLYQHRRFRAICALLLLAISVWIAVASTLLWTSSRLAGVSGLVQYAWSGGPLWLLALPIVAMLTAFITLLPLPGKFTLVAAFATATFGYTLAVLATFQGGGRYAVNATATASGISAILLPVLALILAFGEIPPLDAPLARIAVVYWGRRKHLLALREYGRQRGWRVTGPAGAKSALVVEGAYDPQHPITIISGASFKLSTESAFTFSLVVKMGAPADIISLRIADQPLPKDQQRRMQPQGLIAGESRSRGSRRTLYYYLRPDRTYPLSEAFIAQFAALVEAGRSYLQPRDMVQAVKFGIRYTHTSYRRLTYRDAQLDPLLGWMRDLTTLLEPASPHPVPVPQAAPPPFSDS